MGRYELYGIRTVTKNGLIYNYNAFDCCDKHFNKIETARKYMETKMFDKESNGCYYFRGNLVNSYSVNLMEEGYVNDTWFTFDFKRKVFLRGIFPR